MKKHGWKTGMTALTAIAIFGGAYCFCGSGQQAVYAADGDVTIDAANFPDEVFREYVEDFDVDGNGILSETERNNIIGIDVRQKEIADLKGIEFFSGIIRLNCSGNHLSSLDVSNNRDLCYLYCDNNELNSLDVTGNVNLIELDFAENHLSSIDISQNTELTQLDCSRNNLSSLNLNENRKLISLFCRDNHFKRLSISNNTDLCNLYCNNNELSSLDITQNRKLKDLWCEDNNLKSLDISQNPELTRLRCHSNNLQQLDVSQNVNLTVLYCHSNNLYDLDVSKNINLTELACGYNHLRSLDLSQNVNLTELSCNGNTIEVSAIQHRNNYGFIYSCRIDMPGFLSEPNRLSNLSKGSFQAADERIILPAESVEPRDTLTYDYDTGYTGQTQEFKTITVTLDITAVMIFTEEVSTEDASTESTAVTEAVTVTETVTTASVNGGASGIQETTASQNQDTPKTGDSAVPGWMIGLGIFGIFGLLIGRRGRK